MPPLVADACSDGNLVIFAGAGISTEQRLVVEQPLYVQVWGELAHEGEIDTDTRPDFPALMSAYEGRYGRSALLRRIKSHLDYVRSFPMIDRQASAFHRELSTIYTIKDIVTTNWDDYFERECAAQPFVTEKDWAYWGSGDRKVFKLHGSVNNPGSIVATTSDYEECDRNLASGLLGGRLRELLATKTVVFVGYSLNDPDFTALYRFMKSRMEELLPQSFLVTPYPESAAELAREMKVIRTGGLHFAEELKATLAIDCFLPDERFDDLQLMRALIRELHHQLLTEGEMSTDPAMLLVACYHDGLLDAFDYLDANKSTGKFSHRCDVQHLIADVYTPLQEEREGNGRWHTVSYIEGYINGLAFLLASDEERRQLPGIFLPGLGAFDSLDEYRAKKDDLAAAAPAVYAQARELAARLGAGVVFHHQPLL